MTRSTIKRHTIAVDIDDVVAAHIPEFIRYSNEHYGTNLDVDSYSDDWPTLWGIPLDETLERARRFHDDTISGYEKIEDAEPVLKRLAEKYTLYVVTARQSYTIEATHAWINQHFGGVFTETHFVPWGTKGVTKADICKQIGADYLIDDQPRHCNIAAEEGLTALLFGDYQWVNKDEIHADIVMVNDWQAVAGYFNV